MDPYHLAVTTFAKKIPDGKSHPQTFFYYGNGLSTS